MKNCVGIILAAGMGRRLGELTKDKPKVLLEVNGKTLLEYAVDFIKNLGIEDIIVVAGYRFDKVEEVLSQISPDVKIVNNTDYELQNLVSFSKALDEVKNGGIFTYDADHIFRKENLEKTKNNLRDTSVYCSYDLSGDDEDVMKVKIDESGNMAWMSKTLKDFEAIYTGMFFVEDKVVPALKSLVAGLLKTSDKKEARVEWIFDALMKNGHKIKVADVGRSDWIEVDTPEELALAQKTIKTFEF